MYIGKANGNLLSYRQNSLINADIKLIHRRPNRPEIISCMFFSLKICIDIISYNVNNEKPIWPFWPKAFFSFLAHFRQLLWHNRLDIARCTTTVGGRLYGVTRMALVYNA